MNQPAPVLRVLATGTVPGALHGMRDGTVYEVQKDGSWKKVPAAVALRVHETWKAGGYVTEIDFDAWMLEEAG